MNVKLYYNDELVGEGIVIQLVEGKKMATGFNSPGEIQIQMTIQLSSKKVNNIIIDNDVVYKIDLDDIFDYNIGSIITGDIYRKRKL